LYSLKALSYISSETQMLGNNQKGRGELEQRSEVKESVEGEVGCSRQDVRSTRPVLSSFASSYWFRESCPFEIFNVKVLISVVNHKINEQP
jgi:hypothetical protein